MPPAAEVTPPADPLAAVAAVQAAVEAFAVVRDHDFDRGLSDVLAALRLRYPDVDDALGLLVRFEADQDLLARRLTEGLRYSLQAVSDGIRNALARREELLAQYPEHAARYAPAGFVSTRGLHVEHLVSVRQAGSPLTADYAVVPARWEDGDVARDQLPGLLPPEVLFRKRYYVLGRMAAACVNGRVRPFISIDAIKRHTAALVANQAAVQREDEERLRAEEEEDRQREEQRRLSRPITVGEMEALRRELAGAKA
ncbi:hypothetical protein [Limnoglobus roseus]|uniref:Uncharacterized protein n=1 Tax=Limnoglobus roseus TaxID=2598579 RepID=A0A5C1AFS7_9BACT|nr:hypothetical protein [Limnoglobus roseus]QEL17445.1 hypothetical protein PX52LOC_04434 [Limnoglobus roseus]